MYVIRIKACFLGGDVFKQFVVRMGGALLDWSGRLQIAATYSRYRTEANRMAWYLGSGF